MGKLPKKIDILEVDEIWKTLAIEGLNNHFLI